MQSENDEAACSIATLTSNQVIDYLWNNNSEDKCRIGLADAVVRDHDCIPRWYITSKTGEVLRKREVDMIALSQRWLRISAQNNSPYIAVLRHNNGTTKFVSTATWHEIISGNLWGDETLVSMHCFVRSSNNLAYRSSYEIIDREGRCAISTHSYPLYFENNNNGITDHTAEGSTSSKESKATAINDVTKQATSTAVRYLERTRRIRVVSLSIDYVIDRKSQLWMLWTGSARIVRDTSLFNCVIFGLFKGMILISK